MKSAPPEVKLDDRGLPPPQVRIDYASEVPFWVFLLVSLLVFSAGTLLGIYARWGESPAVMQIDLDFLEGVENEPPPLGDPNAGGPEAPPEETKPPEPAPPPPLPEPEPPPEPIPPPVQPEFPKPEEKPPPKPAPSTPRPKAATPRPAGTPRPVSDASSRSSGENADPNAKPGPRGVASGVVGGRGGQKGGFIARPDPPYDNLMLTRKYQGTGRATLTVSGGRITSVKLSQSTGNQYLDSKAIAWIRSNWKPAPGAEGSFTFPVVFRLR